MSFFPRGFISDPSTSFHPLFRLLDDFDQYSRDVDRGHRSGLPGLKAFTPKFDVKENNDGYELHGELPGIEQKDIEIEFTDANTLTIKGRTERSYERGSRPAGFVEGPAEQATITEGAHNAHKATVEDEGAETAATEVVKKDAKEHAKEPVDKYWVSERSIGEFSRSFSFPVRVDQDAVRASMKNGILSILVPKAKKQASKRISIE